MIFGFGFLGAFFLFFGIGVLAALAWTAIRYGPGLAILFTKTLAGIGSDYAKAAREGIEEGRKINAERLRRGHRAPPA